MGHASILTILNVYTQAMTDQKADEAGKVANVLLEE